MNTGNIVLVGGSGLGPWAWERVVTHLPSDITVITPTLSNSGATDLSRWVEDVVTSVDTKSGNTTLVAHSFAGYVAAAILERHPGMFERVVFVDAALPEPNHSWFDSAGVEVATYMKSLAVAGIVPWFTKEQLDAMYPGHGISDDDLDWMLKHVTGQSISTYEEAPTTRSIDAETSDLIYVRCSLTPAANLPVDKSTPGWAWRTINAGHWPMITAPKALASLITEAA